jgi:hypothetical protein
MRTTGKTWFILLSMTFVANGEVVNFKLVESRPLQLPVSGLKGVDPISFPGGRVTLMPKGWSVEKKEFTNPAKDVLVVSLMNKKAPENVQCVIMNSIEYGAHTEKMASIDIGVTFVGRKKAPINAKQFMARYPDILSLFEAIRVLPPSRPNGVSAGKDAGDMEAAFQSVLAKRANRLFGGVIPTSIRIGKVPVYMSSGIAGDVSWVRIYVCSEKRKSDAVSMLLIYKKNSKKTVSAHGLTVLERLATGLVAGIRAEEAEEAEEKEGSGPGQEP